MANPIKSREAPRRPSRSTSGGARRGDSGDVQYGEVQRVEELSPDLLRIVLGGGTLDRFSGSEATDAYINARFLPAGSPVEVPFTAEDIDGLADEHRPRPRRFTIRRWDPQERLLAIDFVAHGDVGYAGSWAQRAMPGDRLQFEGPGGSYRPSPDADWYLFVGDESALGAIGASLESLGVGDRALVFAVVERPGCEIELPSQAQVMVDWSYRAGAAEPESLLASAVAAASFPDGSFDVFVHGEAGEVRAVRRHLISDRGISPDGASISAYWRRRHADEAWRQVKRQWMAEQSADA